MDTKKLRQKILDLAIHGKLVPQDPNDEPASVLLERIRAEKERLIKEGKIKQSKKSAKSSDTPHYKNEVPFEVPEGWVWTTINDICSKIGSGSTPRGSNYAEKGIPFFRSQNVYNDGLVYDDIKYITEDVHKMMIGTEVRANDLLLNITGGSLGRCAIVPNEFCKGNVSQHVCILRTIIALPAYLHLFIISDYFAATMILSGSGREGLPKYSLEIMQFPLPPLTEQHRIVAAVEQWFSLIDTLESAKEDLQTSIVQAKSKILDLAIHGKLVPQDPSDEPAIGLLKRINPKFVPCDNAQYPYEVPCNWILCELGDLYNIVSAKRVHKYEWQHYGIPFYRAREIVKLSDEGEVDNELFITEEHYNDLKKKYGVPKPTDIIMSAVGTIGKTYIVKADDVFYYKDASVICLQNTNELYSPYISILLSSNFLQEQMFAQSKGTTVDTITIEKANSYKIPFPPLSEQKRIVAKIEELFAVLDEEIKKSLEA